MKPNYLENIPQNWQIKKLKYLFENVIGGVWGNEAQNDENDFICIRVADFNYEKGEVKKNKKFTLRNIKDSEQKNRILEKGDLLLEKSGGGEKTPVGRIVIFDLDKPAVCSNFINLLKVRKEYESTFLNYYFTFLYEKGVSKKYINQTTGIQNLNTSAFFDEKIILPPLSEQQKIANFLDKKTTELDTLIKKKNKLIKLLQEDEKAFINEKLTSKEGKWISRKVNWSFNLIGSGTTPNTNIEEYYKNGTISWVNTGDLNNDILYKSKKKVTELALETHSVLKLYPKNTLLIALYGATIGKVSLLDFEACTNQACCALGESIFFDMKIVFYWFLVNRQKIIDLGYGGGQPNISQDIIKNLRLPCPPIEEQKKIVSEIENHIHKNRQVLEKLSKEVDLLKEYRQSLISEAVTGQLVI